MRYRVLSLSARFRHQQWVLALALATAPVHAPMLHSAGGVGDHRNRRPRRGPPLPSISPVLGYRSSPRTTQYPVIDVKSGGTVQGLINALA